MITTPRLPESHLPSRAQAKEKNTEEEEEEEEEEEDRQGEEEAAGDKISGRIF